MWKHYTNGRKYISKFKSNIKTVSGVLDDYLNMVKLNKERSKINKEETGIEFGLKLSTANLDDLYHEDLKSGNGFDIDTSVNYNAKTLVDMINMVDSKGIYSYMFGPRDDDPKSVEQKRFECSCGKTISGQSGVNCPYCGGETVLVEKLRGWITLNYRVPNPYWWDVLSKHIRRVDNRDKPNSLLKRTTIDKNTKKESRKLIDIINSNLANFKISGEENKWNLIDLQDDKELEKFIRYYVQDEFIDDFLATMSNAMTYHIPVLSKNFRHYSLNIKMDGTPNMQTHPINRSYIEISSMTNQLNNASRYSSSKDILKKLITIYTNFNEIKNKIYLELLDDKESLIRSTLFGGRMSNSGRFVVSGLEDNPRLDVFTMGYKSFGEITQNHFMDLYIKHGATPENLARMRENYPTNEDCDIMDKVLDDMLLNDWSYFLLYRAPCIYFGSQVVCKCIGLHDEDVIRINDITLDGNMKGDKDGDQLAIFCLDRKIALSLFFALNPYRITYNPIKNEVSPKHELFESGYMVLNLAMKENVDTKVFLDGKEVKLDGI